MLRQGLEPALYEGDPSDVGGVAPDAPVDDLEKHVVGDEAVEAGLGGRLEANDEVPSRQELREPQVEPVSLEEGPQILETYFDGRLVHLALPSPGAGVASQVHRRSIVVKMST